LRATESGWELPVGPVPPSESASGAAFALDWIAAPQAVVRLEPRSGARSTLRMRVLELSGAVTPEGMQLHVWTRGRLDRGSVAFAGRLRSDAAERRLRFRLAADDLDLARILRVAPDAGVRDLRGLVSVRAKYDEAGRGDTLRRAVSGSGSARDVAFGARGATVLWLRGLQASRFGVDLRNQSVALARVTLRGGEAWVRESGARRADRPACR
jgi:hypothetical protein